MFSGTVKILDLNDYIKPAEECIVLVKTEKTDKKKFKLEKDDFELPDLIKTKKNKKATIGLEDCLACNGCITSSETILVQEQSVLNLKKNIGKAKKKIMMISPQCRVSLAEKLNKSEKEINGLISNFAKKQGFDYFLDFSIFIEIIQEMEFRNFEKLQEKKNELKLKTNLANKKKLTPLLCSECPGWICYLEKVLGDKIIPYASEVKTPQLVCSLFLRNFLKKCGFKELEDIYIVLISPCFDKKLEAAREEQKNKQVIIDLVLSTEEIYKWMIEEKIDFKDDFNFSKILDFDNFLEKFLLKQTYSLKYLENSFISCEDFIIYKSFTDLGTSNGYVNYFINRLKKKDENSILKNKTKKNLVEYSLENTKTQISINLAFVSGFKNIQNLIRKIKMNKCVYDYVEIMACPSGCLNGGGQIIGDKLKKKESLENLKNIHSKKEYILHYDMIDNFIENLNKEKLEILKKEEVFYKIEEIKVNNVTHISW